MRIAMVILQVDPRRGGAERYTLDLAHAIIQRGHDVDLLCACPDWEIPPGLRVVPVMTPTTGRWSIISLAGEALTRSGRYLAFLKKVDRHISSQPYDIVHAMLPVRRCDLYHPHAGLAAAQIVTGHHKYSDPISRLFSAIGNRLNLRRQLFARTERALLTGTQPPMVLSLSNYVRAEVDRHYRLPDECHATLYNGVDLSRFDPERGATLRARARQQLGLVASDIVALFIGQDAVRKGLPAALAAMEKIEHPDLKLLIVGKPPEMASPTALNKRGLANRVVVAGQMNDPMQGYAVADFLVLPTHHDPCPLVVLEALAMGLPVVSTIKNGACELMTNGLHGYILPDPNDVSALAAAMTNLLDAEIRQTMAGNVHLLREKLSYTHHVDQVLAAYEKAIQRRPR